MSTNMHDAAFLIQTSLWHFSFLFPCVLLNLAVPTCVYSHFFFLSYHSGTGAMRIYLKGTS